MGDVSQTALDLGPVTGEVEVALTRMAEARWAERLWARDGGLWSTDPAGAGDIAFWTGWLDVIDDMNAAAGRLETFAKSVRGDGFTHVVLAGMGGSSLCPDVLRRTFGI